MMGIERDLTRPKLFLDAGEVICGAAMRMQRHFFKTSPSLFWYS
jgi:hypothetical protein